MVSQCERTQLSVLWAAKGVQVSFAVHNHAELSTTGHLDQGLPVVGNLRERDNGNQTLTITAEDGGTLGAAASGMFQS
ncbi:hypothetical protein INR49_000539 [Caranx melampygus]|nr:hypothetical protein INR49_000539 [Caranx melampygus]